jgi:hypothetical protein
MKLWPREKGRQGSGYSKFTLAHSKWFKLDATILRLPTDTHVPPHKDPSLDGFEHHRVNITLRSTRDAGSPISSNRTQPRSARRSTPISALTWCGTS